MGHREQVQGLRIEGWRGPGSSRQPLHQPVQKLLAVEQLLHAHLLIEPVHAALAFLGKEAGDAIGVDAVLPEPAAVCVAARLCGDDGDAGPHVGADFFHRLHDDGRHRRSRGFHDVTDRNDVDGGIGDDALQRGVDLLGVLVRQQAAIHGGAGGLRHGVLGVAGLELGGDAGRADLRVPRRARLQRRERRGGVVAFFQRLDGGAHRRALEPRDGLLHARPLLPFALRQHPEVATVELDGRIDLQEQLQKAVGKAKRLPYIEPGTDSVLDFVERVGDKQGFLSTFFQYVHVVQTYGRRVKEWNYPFYWITKKILLLILLYGLYRLLF